MGLQISNEIYFITAQKDILRRLSSYVNFFEDGTNSRTLPLVLLVGVASGAPANKEKFQNALSSPCSRALVQAVYVPWCKLFIIKIHMLVLSAAGSLHISASVVIFHLVAQDMGVP